MAGCWTPPMKEGPISSGMDVVKSLPDDDSDTMSVSSSSASQKLLLNDDEALKIILNTPTESSPIMERMKSESKRPKQKEMPSQGAEVQDAGGSKDTDGKTISTPAIDLQDPTEAQVSKNKEDESAAQESTTAESEWTETSDDDVGTEKTTPQISTMMSYDTLLESYLPQAAPLVPEDELKKILKNYSQLGASDEPVESAEEPIDQVRTYEIPRLCDQNFLRFLVGEVSCLRMGHYAENLRFGCFQMYESGFEIVEDASPSTKTPVSCSSLSSFCYRLEHSRFHSLKYNFL